MISNELRDWLNFAQGKSVGFNPNVNPAGGATTLIHGAATAPNNGSKLHYWPITVNRAQVGGFGYELQIRNATAAASHGVYLPDVVNQCTTVNATANANGIIVGGQFTGCTFGKCVSAAGDTHVGHIYVSAATPGNNPANQATALKAAAGLAAGAAAEGFQTAGGVVAGGASRGYVIGTFVAAAWQWNWVTVNPQNVVVECRILGAADWVAL